MEKTEYIQIDSNQDKEEVQLVKDYANILGLKLTTALKLFIRQFLPVVIKDLTKSTDINTQSNCKCQAGGNE